MLDYVLSASDEPSIAQSIGLSDQSFSTTSAKASVGADIDLQSISSQTTLRRSEKESCCKTFSKTGEPL